MLVVQKDSNPIQIGPSPAGEHSRPTMFTTTSLAGAVGIEPTYAVLEAAVLPLDDTPVGIGGNSGIRTLGGVYHPSTV